MNSFQANGVSPEVKKMNPNSRFEELSWHDNAIHGFRLVEGDDSRSGDFVLDIDFILEWKNPGDGQDEYGFRLAPANLTFHEVSDLIVSIDFAACNAALQPMCIHQIQREEIAYPGGFSTFAWRIELNWPRSSYFSFCAKSFTQSFRADPVLSGAQYLLPSQRSQ